MKVVRLSALRTSRLNPPGNIPGTHFCQRMSQPQDHCAAGRIMSMNNSNDIIGNRTHDLPACSVVPQPTVPPRNPKLHYRNQGDAPRTAQPNAKDDKNSEVSEAVTGLPLGCPDLCHMYVRRHRYLLTVLHHILHWTPQSALSDNVNTRLDQLTTKTRHGMKFYPLKRSTLDNDKQRNNRHKQISPAAAWHSVDDNSMTRSSTLSVTNHSILQMSVRTFIQDTSSPLCMQN